MKKLFLTMCVALFTMGVQAQEKGDFAVGLHVGPTITQFEIQDWDVNETTAQWGVGAFGQYNLSKHWRVELEGTFHPMKDHVSDFMVGLNFHYLINLTKNHNFKLYPLLGYGLTFAHQEEFTEGGATFKADNMTDGGIQLGLGLQANLPGDRWFLTGEYRYLPGIFGDCHVALLGLGYRF